MALALPYLGADVCMLVYFADIELGVGPSTLFNPLKAPFLLCLRLWKGKEHNSPSQTLGVPSVRFTNAIGTPLHHFPVGGPQLDGPCLHSNGCYDV